MGCQAIEEKDFEARIVIVRVIQQITFTFVLIHQALITVTLHIFYPEILCR